MAILECRELTKYFDSSLALDHVSLTVEPGRIVGLLGPNGSGKSTLIKLANGLLVPSSGVVTIDGHAPGPETKELVSYLPERTYLSGWMNVVQLLDFFCDFYPDFDRDAAEHMLTALEISPKLRIRQMSKGTRGKGAADPGHEPPGPAVSAGRAHRRRGPRHPGLYHPHHSQQL